MAGKVEMEEWERCWCILMEIYARTGLEGFLINDFIFKTFSTYIMKPNL
jgi:hypothetical protein